MTWLVEPIVTTGAATGLHELGWPRVPVSSSTAGEQVVGQLMTTLAPDKTMVSETGASTTVTVKVQTLLLPLASRATFVTVVTPGGKVLPEGGVEVMTGLASQMSVAVTLKVTMLPPGVPVHWVEMFVEHMIIGGVVSTTVTMNEQLLLLPVVSVDTQRTVVTPRWKVLPETGEQTSTGLVSHRSEVVTT